MKASKEKIGESFFDAYKEMSRAVGVKKPQEAQKAKALWKMKAAKRCRRIILRSHACRQHPGKKQDKISTLGRAPQRSNCGTGQSTEVCENFVSELPARVLGGRSVLQWLAVASSKVCGKTIWEGAWPTGSDGWCVFTQSVHGVQCARKVRAPHGELLFFFLIQNEPATVPDSVTFSLFINADIRTPLISADVLKKCALVALHFITEEGRDGEGCHVPGLGDEWEMG